jgi:hypothetical protein
VEARGRSPRPATSIVQIVELAWLIGHFRILNRWFTVLQVPHEGPVDEADFVTLYERVVPADMRERNA